MKQESELIFSSDRKSQSNIEIVALNSGKEVVGRVLAQIYFKKFCIIEHLAVWPDYRGRQIGRQLLSQAEQWAVDNEGKTMFMRLALCDLVPMATFSLARLLTKNGYNFVGLGFMKTLLN